VVKVFEKALVMYIYAETPIHPGSGIALGIVDLPIQRERHTEFPMIQGSSIKGVLRNFFVDLKVEEKVKINGKNLVDIIFGEENSIGGISVTDAKILAFPVRTLKGVFGWITCPLVLDRYKRDLNLAGKECKWEIPKLDGNNKAIVCDSNASKKYVYIEDLQLECTYNENIKDIAETISNALPDDDVYKEIKKKLKKDLIIVSDEIFRDLVTLTTEVVTRIKIDPENGTVQKGALWTEEYLPTDTIMYSLILIPSRLSNLKIEIQDEELKRIIESKEETSDKIVEILKNFLNKQVLQIGGDETIGKGFVRIKIEGEGNAKKS